MAHKKNIFMNKNKNNGI